MATLTMMCKVNMSMSESFFEPFRYLDLIMTREEEYDSNNNLNNFGKEKLKGSKNPFKSQTPSRVKKIV